MKIAGSPVLWLLMAAVIVVGTVGKAVAQPKPLFHDVRDYGAVANDQGKDTDAIRKAIDAAVSAGGGTIYFSAGQFLSGPIHLKSNITLHLDAGAVLLFTQDFNDYLPMVKSRWEGTEVNNFSPCIYAYQAENIAIEGRGAIDGQGKAWWDYMRKARQGGVSAEPTKWFKLFAEANPNSPLKDRYAAMGNFLRPPMIQPVECRNVRIEGVSLRNPPFWTVNPVYCDNLTVDGVFIKNPDDSPNTDGINPDSCRNVHIANCHISVGDDCITIKSGRDADGRRVGRPCENITVTNCTMLDGHGGVVIGSEMSGGVRRVAISNCVFVGTDRGIRIKTTRGRGGAIEDIRVSNIVMNDIKASPFDLNMFYEKVPQEPVSERTPVLRNVHISGVIVKGGPAAGFLLGLPEMPIEDVTFTDVHIDTEKGLSCSEAKNIAFRDMRINTKTGPALICENVADLEVEGFTTLTPHEAAPVVSLKNVSGAYIHGCRAVAGTGTFLQVQGEKSRDFLIQANDLVKAASALKTDASVPDFAIKQDK